MQLWHVVALLLCIIGGNAKELYVDPNGTDDEACYDGGVPCKTLSFIFNSGPNIVINDDDIISLMPGTHFIIASLNVNARVTIQSSDNNVANIQCADMQNNDFAFFFTASGITMKDISMSGCGIAVRAERVNNIIIQNCHFYSCFNSISLLSVSSFSLLFSSFSLSSSSLPSLEAQESHFLTVISSNFINNQESTNNGYLLGIAVHLLSSFNASFNNCQFTNNYKLRSAGTITLRNSSASFSHSLFHNNSNKDASMDQYACGGALTIVNSFASFIDCNFSNNFATWGGAVAGFLSDVHIINSTFDGNTASNIGGAVYLQVPSYGLIINTTFINGEANGGAIEGDKLDIHFSTFQNNYGRATAGAIRLLGISSISHSKFISNTATYRAAVLVEKSATFDNCQFTNNDGGAIYIETLANGTFTNCQFTDNNSPDGAAIFASNSRMVIINKSFFFNNNANSNGGAINSASDILNVRESEFINNNVIGGGGAIMASSIDIRDCFFRSNSAVSGGAILAIGWSFMQNVIFEVNYAENGGAMNLFGVQSHLISNSKFTGNFATKNGGAVTVQSTTATFEKCDFDSNKANHAGAMDLSSESTVFTIGCSFLNHNASYGSVIKLQSANYMDTNSTFTLNHAETGTIHSFIASLSLTLSSFILNDALESGGAVRAERSFVSLAGCSFLENTASVGGALHLFNTTLQDLSSTFSKNKIIIRRGQGSGGAIFASDMMNVSFSSSLFENNEAVNPGGAIIINGGNITFYYCKWKGNKVRMNGGGGLHVIQMNVISSLILDGCVFSDNYSPDDGGGAHIRVNYTVAMNNCTFEYNEAGNSGGGYFIISSLSDNGSIYNFNYARNGGAFASSENASFINSYFSNNIAVEYGGAAALLPSTTFPSFSSFSFSGCTWINNVGELNSSRGSAVYGLVNGMAQSKLTLSNCTFDRNQGGAVYVDKIALEANNISYINIQDTFSGTYEGGNCSTYTTSPSHSFNCDCVGDSPAIGYACESHYRCYTECNFDNSLCNVLHNGTLLCTCDDGFYFDGTCKNIDECEFVPPICGPNAYCYDSPGNYSCACMDGYTNYGLYCTKPTVPPIDKCLANNGGCDYRVTCFMEVNETITCGPCPTGTIGSGYTKCNSSCGDGNCDGTILEDCVTCPQDCSAATCNTCGDNVCDATETCATCFRDCGTCNIGCARCVHGKCEQATCICESNWYGPSCSLQNNQQTNFTVNNTKPDVSVDTPGERRNFYISILKISEVSGAARREIRHISIKNIEFNFFSQRFGNNTKNTYIAPLENGADIEIIFLSEALIDGRKQRVEYFLNNDNSVDAVLPHFWETADMDPNYSVLIHQDEDEELKCKEKEEKGESHNIIAIVVPCVVGGVVILTVLAFLIPKIKDRRKIKKNAMKSNMELYNLRIEKTPDMQVHTTSDKSSNP